MATKSIQQNKKMNGKLVALAVLLIAVVGGAVHLLLVLNRYAGAG